jgi:Leucine-rich repeat (LRR) protein
MKKVVLLIALALGTGGAFAQKINSKELKQLQAFLTQPAELVATNAQALNITDLSNPIGWEGVTIENGHVVQLQWKGKHLAGSLNLSGFSALKEVNVSRNNLSQLSVANNPVLASLDASRNKLSDFSADNCSSLNNLKINRNRLTTLNLSGTMALKTLNCSGNLFVELSVANSPTLVTLNCQDCHIEALNI